MAIEHARHDFYADEMDEIDGKHWVYAKANPTDRREIVQFLDAKGAETDDPEDAAGGVVKLGEDSFTVFTL